MSQKGSKKIRKRFDERRFRGYQTGRNQNSTHTWLGTFLNGKMVNMPLPEASLIMKNNVETLGKVPVLGSILMSIKRGKSTEIDYLNREIVNSGKKVGIATPANSLIVELHEVTSKVESFA